MKIVAINVNGSNVFTAGQGFSCHINGTLWRNCSGLLQKQAWGTHAAWQMLALYVLPGEQPLTAEFSLPEVTVLSDTEVCAETDQRCSGLPGISLPRNALYPWGNSSYCLHICSPFCPS